LTPDMGLLVPSFPGQVKSHFDLFSHLTQEYRRLCKLVISVTKTDRG
jgi:hypothetical protein